MGLKGANSVNHKPNAMELAAADSQGATLRERLAVWTMALLMVVSARMIRFIYPNCVFVLGREVSAFSPPQESRLRTRKMMRTLGKMRE